MAAHDAGVLHSSINRNLVVNYNSQGGALVLSVTQFISFDEGPSLPSECYENLLVSAAFNCEFRVRNLSRTVRHGLN
jgi:hypothetical protein